MVFIPKEYVCQNSGIYYKYWINTTGTTGDTEGKGVPKTVQRYWFKYPQ